MLTISASWGLSRHSATVLGSRGRLSFQATKRSELAPAAGNDGSNSQSQIPSLNLPIHRKIKHSSLASRTETGQYGQIELVDVGDDTPRFAEFVAQQAGAAYDNKQICLLVTMVPQCPGCASLGYALARSSLRNSLGKVRIVRLDLDEFEEELRNLHLPIDRVPGFIRLDRHGKAVDFLDAGEWNTNDPAEYAPIIEAFLQGRLKLRRHPWVRNPDSSAVDL